MIRQRETAVPDERAGGPAQPVASIAPDGLENFARDLRTLRAQAELDYPEMAETSHFSMKTLVAAAGGLRLPTLPVAVAYVRACGGNVAEWEDRWQKLAAKITRRGDEAPERRRLPRRATRTRRVSDRAGTPAARAGRCADAGSRSGRGLRHHLRPATPARLVTGARARRADLGA